jgi:hypothetical protein
MPEPSLPGRITCLDQGKGMLGTQVTLILGLFFLFGQVAELVDAGYVKSYYIDKKIHYGSIQVRILS